MKLNINTKELLALYNILLLVVDQTKDVTTGDLLELRNLHNRIKSIIIATLSKNDKPIDEFDAWVKGQRQKIEKLAQQSNVETTTQIANPCQILTDNDDEITQNLSYPSRKGRHRSKKHRDT